MRVVVTGVASLGFGLTRMSRTADTEAGGRH